MNTLSGPVIAPSVKEATASEDMLSRLVGNNEQLNLCVVDLRTFIARAVGESSLKMESEADRVESAGVLGSIGDKLHNQSTLIQELREVVLRIEKIA